jgi:hypothetical protein
MCALQTQHQQGEQAELHGADCHQLALGVTLCTDSPRHTGEYGHTETDRNGSANGDADADSEATERGGQARDGSGSRMLLQKHRDARHGASCPHAGEESRTPAEDESRFGRACRREAAEAQRSGKRYDPRT